jgi:hypothetical protein
MSLGRLDQPSPLGRSDIRTVRQVPGFVDGNGADAVLEISLAEEVSTTAGNRAPVYTFGHIRIASLILHLVEFATLERATEQKMQ